MRIVTILPNNRWGGEGFLGGEIGVGLLHRLPEQSRKSTGTSKEFVSIRNVGATTSPEFKSTDDPIVESSSSNNNQHSNLPSAKDSEESNQAHVTKSSEFQDISLISGLDEPVTFLQTEAHHRSSSISTEPLPTLMEEETSPSMMTSVTSTSVREPPAMEVKASPTKYDDILFEDGTATVVIPASHVPTNESS